MGIAVTAPQALRTAGTRSPLLNWLLCWVILPNAPFCALWLIGGPPRIAAIFATGAVGLLVCRAPFAVRYAAFVIMLIHSLMRFVSALFGLGLASLLPSLRFIGELNPAASPEYVALAAAVAATLAAAWWLLQLPQRVEGGRSVALACVGVAALAGADRIVTWESRGYHYREPTAATPFSSAVSQTGFAALGRGNHLLVVVVESLGLPLDPALQDKQFPRLKAARDRYTIETGSTSFFGSTTNGEIRELCGRWDDFLGMADREADPDCLPAVLARQGYDTTAVHGFGSVFFDRASWYPKVGFRHTLFEEQLRASGVGGCAGVFAGACDREIPAILKARILAAEKPQFHYWLTLNSHLPVPIDPGLGTDRCAGYDLKLARSNPMECRMFQLWDEIDRGLADLALDPRLPPTDILIVGDHMPPFVDRASRRHFDPQLVPWILLKHKRRAGGVIPLASAAPELS